MLLNEETLKGITSGTITLAFRRWRRPTVKTGGTLLTSAGQLSVEAVDEVDPESITEAEAVAAGFPDLESLRASLLRRDEGSFYRVQLALAGPDPRIALRDEIPQGDDLEVILSRLRRFDSKSAAGPWTRQVLDLLRRRPGERAGDLAEAVGMERAGFKGNVRKLKGLGLTESLSVGYRLSPRGKAVLKRLEGGGDVPSATPDGH
jgi:hypothetical protein